MSKAEFGARTTRNLFRVKRVYEPPTAIDGMRVLVDRLWPRGIGKEQAKVHTWIKEIAPSAGLRVWFDHRSDRWPEFRKRYAAELRANHVNVAKLDSLAAIGPVTLLYAARDEVHNHAVVLLAYMQRRVPRQQL
jgi:uncharacterized protein YeaO (DUF488 family)